MYQIYGKIEMKLGFFFFFTFSSCVCCLFTMLVKDSGQAWSPFGDNYLLKSCHVGLAEKHSLFDHFSQNFISLSNVHLSPSARCSYSPMSRHLIDTNLRPYSKLTR